MDFAQIFTQMSWVSAAFLFVGLIFIVVEVLLPGFGFFGISGIASLVIGILIRVCEGLTLVQTIVLILLILGFFAIALLIMLFSAQHGILSRTGIFEKRSTLDENFNQPDEQLNKLVGKWGKTVSALNLGGKAKIKGKIYDVVSINSYIDAGKFVKVVEIKDNTIMVRGWF